MAIGRPNDITQQYKQNVYNIQLDISGWDRVTIGLVNPAAAINVYGSNDAGAVQGTTDGNATLATNFTPLQVTNLATGAASTNMAASGNYKFEANARFVRLAGLDAEKIIIQNTKNI
jgi:hypothetical protein